MSKVMSAPAARMIQELGFMPLDYTVFAALISVGGSYILYMSEETTMITLTDNAVKKVQEFFQNEPEAKGKSLRIALEAGGCSGFQYAFGFDVKRPDDSEVSCEGFSVLIDPQSAQHLKGSSVDY